MDAQLVSAGLAIVPGLAGAGLGAVAGCAHLILLGRNVKALAVPKRSIPALLASLGRFPLSLAILIVAARLGAAALAASLVGFLAARALLLRRAERLVA